MYRIYRDSLLLARIVDSCGLRKDLVSVFGKDIADEKSSRNGYFAIVCVNIDKKEHDAAWILSTYRKRDMQEKAFTYMKSWQNGRSLRTSAEMSTEGRRLSQFVTLIINCQLHHLYSLTSSDFRKALPTPWSMLDVRFVQLKGRRPKVSEFVGKQIDIFDELGFEIPKGCRPTSRKKQKNKKK